MLMVCVVGVLMLVIHSRMGMRVCMFLSQMKPQPESHQRTCEDELDAEMFMQ